MTGEGKIEQKRDFLFSTPLRITAFWHQCEPARIDISVRECHYQKILQDNVMSMTMLIYLSLSKAECQRNRGAEQGLPSTDSLPNGRKSQS